MVKQSWPPCWRRLTGCAGLLARIRSAPWERGRLARIRRAAPVFSALILAACTPAPAPTPTPTTDPEPPWNVVLLLADDLAWNQVGYHGTTYYETPTIDAIAAAGMRFSNAYSANPVCSPTRASLMTGKNPARLQITDYIPGSPYPYARLLRPAEVPGLPLEEVTIAELMKSQGYATGHFGKWHLNVDKEYVPGRPMDPESQGFDEHPRDRQAGVRGRSPGGRAPCARDHRAVTGVPRREPGPAVLPLRFAPCGPPSAAGRTRS